MAVAPPDNSYSSMPRPSIYSPAPSRPSQPQIDASLLSRLYSGQNAAIDTQVAFLGADTANTEAEYQVNKQYLNDQQSILMRQLGLKDEEIRSKQEAIARQRPLQGQMADLQRREFETQEAALLRQMQGLEGQRGLEQQLWGLERQQLGEEKEQDIYAAMRARQAAESEAVVRGALESVGYGRNLDDVAKQLAWELADIDRRYTAQGIKENRYDLNYQEQQAQLRDAYSQVKDVDRQRYYLQYHENLAQLDDENYQLELLGQANGMSKEDAELKLQYALDKLEISKAVSVTDIARARADLEAGRFNPLQSLFGDIAAIGGLNLGSGSGSYSSVGGYEVDSGLAPRFQHVADTFGLTPSSGLRSPEANAAANGVPNSAHLSGRAMDFSGSMDQMVAARDWAIANGAAEALIHDAGSGMHLHIAW